ncbi:hypothetical protein [Nioella sp.]|uniref:hypothetical protein n=1 Tax=Nioella sp. TaxID=1912091 RepID=UPI003A83628F
MTDQTTTKTSGSIIFIGCGGVSNLLVSLADHAETPERFVLIDPAEEARDAVPEALVASGLSHLQGVPASEKGRSEAIYYSLPGLVSVSEPTEALNAIFPGLRISNRSAIDLIESDAIVEELTDLPEPINCFIDLPGAEAGILDVLQSTGLLARLSKLVIRCGVQEFFAGALESDAIESRLSDRGYALIAVNTEDPDWPELCFFGGSRVARMAQLESELASMRSKLDAEVKDRDAKLSQRGEELARISAELETTRSKLSEREASLAEATSRLTDAQKESEAREASLGAVSEKLEKAIKDHESELASMRSKLDAEVKDRDAKLSQRGEELARISAELETTRSKLSEREASLAEAEKAHSEKVSELREALETLQHRTNERDEARKWLSAHDTAIRDREQALQQARSELESSKAALAERESELNAASNALNDTTSALSVSESSLKRVRDSLAQLEVELRESKREQSRYAAALEAAETRMDQANAERALQVRMNAMLQIDLDNLRKQFERSENQRRAQEELLLKLTPKLAQAAEHLQQLQLTAPEEQPVEVETAPKKSATRKTATKRSRPATRTKRGS